MDEKIEKIKKFGLGALLQLYDLKLLLKGAKWPFFLSSVLVLVFIYKGSVDKTILQEIVEIIISSIPNLLGFVLGGYALLIGFGNIEFIAKKRDPIKPSVYQKLSAVFAMGILIQVVLFIFAFVIKYILKANFECSNVFLCKLINNSIFFLLSFGLFYVVIMIRDLAINIFDFSQVQHFLINKKKPIGDDKTENSEPAENDKKTC